jgi:hypothetical protein
MRAERLIPRASLAAALAVVLASPPARTEAGPRPVWKARIEGAPGADITGAGFLADGDVLFAGGMEQGASAGGAALKPPEPAFTGAFWGRIGSGGRVLWAKTVGPGFPAARAFAVDGAGNAFLGVDFPCESRRWAVGRDTVDGRACGHSFYVAKLDPGGEVIWARDWPLASEEPWGAALDALAADDSGNVYVSGIQPMLPGWTSSC